MKRTSKKLHLSKSSIRVLDAPLAVTGGRFVGDSKVGDTCNATGYPPCQDQGQSFFCYTIPVGCTSNQCG
jgi:hypothetical protein